MAKVTSKRQVTIPKAIADQYGIKAGDELDFEPAGDGIRVSRARIARRPLTREERLRSFDEATERQRERERANPRPVATGDDRGWTREELYGRRGEPR